MSKAESKPQQSGEGELDKAIEELKGVLHEEAPRGGAVNPDDNRDLIMGIPVELQIVLGTAEMPVSQLMALKKDSTVSLNRRIGEPVEIVVNGRRIARGEITLVDDDPSRFGVRLTEIAGTGGK
ncbi:flagellar motor switch protein FliN [Nitratireductor sp. ZSWI3]|uniref:flagellar motor switch protein FliN n=1 Tax=Nitratireductor sp. ZSWI3 TaxID=2966359 RepID=UPI00214F753D|nr:flagellar motor switch protein FliN [Nitratireductor sp. ZSWI3]MCR4268342.1 flagellar motor switch protein FliN [Nitratireductor sp. ZSWI3]